MLLFDTRKLLFLWIFKKGKRYPESSRARGVLFAYFGLGTLLYSRSIGNKKVKWKIGSNLQNSNITHLKSSLSRC